MDRFEGDRVAEAGPKPVSVGWGPEVEGVGIRRDPRPVISESGRRQCK
jgi:hypothetical protein